MKGLLRKILYKFFFYLPLPKLSPAKIEIDVIIAAIPKDLEILPLCLKGIRSCINHKIGNIYIISPEEQVIIDFCREKDVIYVNEKSVLGYTPRDLTAIFNKDLKSRKGWIFQQLLKLSGKVGTSDYYLCIDADHVLIKPHTFITENGKHVFYQSSEYHSPYYKNLVKLMKGSLRLSPLSYVAHKMIFSRAEVQKLQKHLETIYKTYWNKAIMINLDENEKAGFSEFELYGNFVEQNKKYSRPWKESILEYSKITNFEDLQLKYSSKFNSLTFPEWLKHKKK